MTATVPQGPTPVPTGREMPCDFEAERATLGAVLLKPAAFFEVKAALVVDDFVLPAHREIFSSMLGIDARGGDPGDVITVADDLRVRGVLKRLAGGEEYLLDLSNAVPTAENVRHYAILVQKKAGLRKLIHLCADTMIRAYGGEELDDVLGDHRASMVNLSSRGSDEPDRVGDDIDEAIDVIEQKSLAPEKHAVLSGLPEFDRKIGGMREEQLVVVAATPGMGKTSWCTNTMFRSAIRMVPNLFFSLEMSKQELIERLIGSSENVEVRKLVRGDLDTSDWRRVHDAPKRLGPLPLYIFDKVVRLDQMEAIARRWRAKFADQICLLTFDYLQLMDVLGSAKMNDTEKFTIITRTLKLLAKDLKCPIQLVSQLNRDSEKDGTADKPRTPRLSDLRGSGSIGQDADMVIFIAHRSEDTGGASKGPVEAPIVIGKHRGGPRGTLAHVTWDGRYSSFYSNDEAEAEALRDPRLPGFE